MAEISFSQAIAILKEKYKEARDSKYVSKPISWALYQTWRKVDIIEKRCSVPRVGGQIMLKPASYIHKKSQGSLPNTCTQRTISTIVDILAGTAFLRLRRKTICINMLSLIKTMI